MPTIIGTSGADNLVGSGENDLIQGLGGNDTLSGGAGNDRLEGGEGNDTMDGGAGDDVLVDDADLNSDTFRDTSGGNDSFYGGFGFDYMYVQRNSNLAASVIRMESGAGDDTLQFIGFNGFVNDVTILAGADNDSVQVSGVRTAVIDAGSGNDFVRIDTLGGAYTVTLGSGADVLELGAPGSSFAVGNPIIITDFATGAGGDRLDTTAYLNAVLTNWNQTANPFGTGHLRLVQSGADTLFQIDRNGGGDGFATLMTFQNTNATSFTTANIGFPPDGSAAPPQTIVGTSAADNLVGAAGNDLIQGLGGNDTLSGGAGNDRLEGGEGNDTMDGGAGDDVLVDDADLNSDTFRDTSGGNDSFYGGFGFDYMYVQRNSNLAASVIRMESGAGDDTLQFIGFNGFVNDVTILAGADNDSVQVSGVRTAVIDAGSGNDFVRIDTLGGAYTVTLGSGADVLELGAPGSSFAVGNPIIITDFATGAGGDRLDTTAYLNAVLTNWNQTANPFGTGHLRLVQSGADTLFQIDRNGGGDGFATLMTFQNTNATSFTTANIGFPPDGSAAPPQTIVGTSAADNLVGAAGNDLIQGLGGNDTLSGGAGNDRLEGGEGNDTMDGGAGDDVLVDDADLNSDTFRDTSGGNDSFYGGFGFDYMYVQRNSNLAASVIRMESGAGDDTLQFIGFNGFVNDVTILAGADNDSVQVSGVRTAVIDAGSGNDFVRIDTLGGAYTVTLGSGADVLELGAPGSSFAVGNPIIITDFATGAGGDRLDTTAYLNAVLTNWNQTANPFGTGHLRLVQSGADTLFQIDRNGGGDGFATLMTFQNTNATSFTTANIGFPPGSYLAGAAGTDNLVGSSGVDFIYGLAGNDIIRGGGGDDVIDGGAGVDAADYVGVRRQYVASSTSVAGGPEGGTDALIAIEGARFVDGTLTFDVNSQAAQIMRLYDAALDRQPDQGGFEAQLDNLERGVSLAALANAFVNSAEFQSRYGALSNQQFVEQLYRFCLDREGDAQGVQGWVNNLNNGLSRRDALVLFSESDEHRTLTAPTLNRGLWVADDNATTIARLYDATFDRLPDAGGLGVWTTHLTNGVSALSIAGAFAASQEFQDRYGALSNQQFVEQMYRFCLNREGDAEGVAGWVNNMNNGLSRAAVLLSFSESAEHVALTAPLWLGGVRFAGYVESTPLEDLLKDSAGEAQVLPLLHDDIVAVETGQPLVNGGTGETTAIKFDDPDAFVLPALGDDQGPLVLPDLDTGGDLLVVNDFRLVSHARTGDHALVDTLDPSTPGLDDHTPWGDHNPGHWLH